MSDFDAFSMSTKGLEAALKLFKGKTPVIRIGVIGEAGRKESGPNNAEIAAAHEYGTEGRLPERSFLRTPISENLDERLEAIGAFDPKVLKDAIESGSMVPWMKKVAVEAEGIVADAFDSGGFGKWTPSNMKRKKNHQTLIETQQLRESITSEVVE